MIGIKDIARLAGVSTPTVSRVINNREHVRPEIRERVLSLVRQTGFVPNSAARCMVLKRNRTVGIVIPDSFNMFQRQILVAIERGLESGGYKTLFFFVKWDIDSELAALKRLKSEVVDGIIIIHEVRHPEFFAYLGDAGMPAVLCTFERPGSGFPSVHVDDAHAAADAVRHLITLGHRRIGLISDPNFGFGIQRSAGYRHALEAAGIPHDERDVAFVPAFGTAEGQAGMHELLARRRRVTAIFAITDELAIGAMRALAEAGIAVPGGMSIVGFDDIDIGAFLSPGLSTIKQPIQEIGRKAAEIMCGLIEGRSCARELTIADHRLVVRESTDFARERTAAPAVNVEGEEV